MKKSILAILLATALLPCAAREHSRANMAVEYNYDFPNENAIDTVIMRSDKMILQVAPDESRFYSIKTEFHDSLYASPGGREMINRMALDALNASGGIKRDANGNITSVMVSKDAMRGLPTRGATFSVYKYPSEGTMTVFDYIHLTDNEYFEYSVPMDSLQWEPGDKTEVILGYECQNATADFGGRRWEAWFAPEIAVAEGPWLLAGLPGLILKAVSHDGLYTFTATGIRNTDEAIRDIPGNPATEKLSGEEEFRQRRSAARKALLRSGSVIVADSMPK